MTQQITIPIITPADIFLSLLGSLDWISVGISVKSVGFWLGSSVEIVFVGSSVGIVFVSSSVGPIIWIFYSQNLVLLYSFLIYMICSDGNPIVPSHLGSLIPL